ncbi:MAG TPA: hypothetical protein VGQ18_07605 [Gemmatimonadales bacterium]|jgi:hypothetical protein|nr:hypothetical protein [Gemmatimonadales bacterium]
MVLRRTIRAGRKGVAAAAALAVFSASCGAGWHQPKQLQPGTLSPRQQVQVWSGGTARRWHAVRVGPDSISGIPFVQPTTCDTCRIAVPRGAVDSLRLGDPIEGFWKTVALVLGTFTLALIYTCRGGCGADY